MLCSRFRSVLRDQRGGYTIFLLYGIMIVLIVSGLALDYSAALLERQKLRAAVDAATAAATRAMILDPGAQQNGNSPDSIEQRAKSVLEENLLRAGMSQARVQAAKASARVCFGRLSEFTTPCTSSAVAVKRREAVMVTAATESPVMFLRILPAIPDFLEMGVAASMEVMRYRVAIVMDSTGSMNAPMGAAGDPPCPGCAGNTRMDWLKYSAKSFLDQLLPFDEVILVKYYIKSSFEEEGATVNESESTLLSDSSLYWKYYLNDAQFLTVGGKETIPLENSDGSSNLPAIKAEIDKMVPTSNTNIGAGIRLARNALSPSASLNLANTQLMMVVITDGVPYRNDVSKCWKSAGAGKPPIPSEGQFGAAYDSTNCTGYRYESPAGSGQFYNIPRTVPLFAGAPNGQRTFNAICKKADGTPDGTLQHPTAGSVTFDGDLDWLQKMVYYSPGNETNPWYINRLTLGGWYADPIIDADDARDQGILVYTIGLGTEGVYSTLAGWRGIYQIDNDSRHSYMLRRIANDQRHFAEDNSPPPNTMLPEGKPDFPCVKRYSEIQTKPQGKYFPANSGEDMKSAFGIIAYETRQKMMR